MSSPFLQYTQDLKVTSGFPRLQIEIKDVSAERRLLAGLQPEIMIPSQALQIADPFLMPSELV